jgi:hypothetical protein
VPSFVVSGSDFWVSEHRYWLVDKAEMFPNAPADIDGIWLHSLHRIRQRPQ